MSNLPLAVVALVVDGDKILTVSRRNDPASRCLPGGKVDEGETPEEAVSREFNEETGAFFTPLGVVRSGICPGGPDGVDYYSMTYYGIMHGEPKPMEEGIDVGWGTWDDVVNGPFRATNTVAQQEFERLRDEGAFREPTEYEKLAPYHRHEGPMMAVDAFIYSKRHDSVAIITRKYEPFGHCLPGGHVDYGESLKDAVIREAWEEVRLLNGDIVECIPGPILDQPGRDPRKHTVTRVFFILVSDEFEPIASDDASSVQWVKREDLLGKYNYVLGHHPMILSGYHWATYGRENDEWNRLK